VNKEIRRERFQESFEIKSKTINSGKEVLLKERKAGEKKSMVGI
jgi:hypothetical protein